MTSNLRRDVVFACFKMLDAFDYNIVEIDKLDFKLKQEHVNSAIESRRIIKCESDK